MGYKARRGTFAASAELDELYDRGWPYLRILTDEAVTAKAAQREARKALEAIDPYLPTHVPRDVARRYLRGYIIADPYRGKAEVEQAIADDHAAIDRGWLDQILARKIGPSPTQGYGGETYDFRLAEVVFLFEAFLGTETVVDALVGHLVAARDNPRWWGDAFSQDHHNAAARRLVPILGWLRLRMEPRRWRAAIAALAGSQPKLPGYIVNLAALIDDDYPLDRARHPEWFAMQRRDKRWLKAHLTDRCKEWGYWQDPQIYYLVGASLLDGQDVSKLARLPKWWQLRIIDEFGTMRAPQVTRVMMALLRSRSAGAAAASWLAAHGHDNVEPAATRSPEQLQARLEAMINAVGARLHAQDGDPKKERQVLDRAFAEYCEIRAALEDPIPEAYFTHHLGDVCHEWNVDQDSLQRWMELAIEAAMA